VLVPRHARLEEFAIRHGDALLTDAEKARIDEQVRRAAYHIIAGKGATYYGIGSAVAHLAQVLLYDQRAVLTICSRIQGWPDCEGVTLGLPHLLDAAFIGGRAPTGRIATAQAEGRNGISGQATHVFEVTPHD